MNVPGVNAKNVGSDPASLLVQPPSSPAPLGIIGTAGQGPAFVPFDIANTNDMVKIFGSVGQENFGLLAAQQWFANGGGSVIFIRTLGAGDGNPRTTSGNNTGRVQNSGFVVGQQIVNTASNVVGKNPYAGSTTSIPGVLGRTYFLTALMSESNGSTIFSDAGIQKQGENIATPIIRGVLFAPSGVVPSLYNVYETNNTVTKNTAALGFFGAGGDGGSGIGTVQLMSAKQEFKMLLNGHAGSLAYPNEVNASFDPEAVDEDTLKSKYFANVFNTDPTKIQEAGHYLYAHYNIPRKFANITGVGVVDSIILNSETEVPVAYLLSSSAGRNTGSITNTSSNLIGIPNFENFEDRFSGAFTPFVISQKISGKNLDLFRFHTITDGSGSLGMYKVVISNITPPKDQKNTRSSFNVSIYDALSKDGDEPLQIFKNCDLDPSSPDFIEKKIGSLKYYYDFDSSNDGDKITTVGDYPQQSYFVRVAVSEDLKNGYVPANALPVGFRGIYHLVTSGSSVNGSTSILTGSLSSIAVEDFTVVTSDTFKKVSQPPLPFRESLSVTDADGTKRINSNLTWGVQYSSKPSPTQTNSENTTSNALDDSIFSYLKFFPSFHTTLQNPWVGDNAGTPDIGGCILDADRFNNNFFSLERVLVITGSTGNNNNRDVRLPDENNFAASVYKRNGIKPSAVSDVYGQSTDKIRFLDPEFDLKDDATRQYMNFTLPFMGGFDGLNIFDEQKSLMTDWAINRENSDPSLTGKRESTTVAYIKSLDILKEKQDCDPQIISIPGIRHRAVIDQTIAASEDRFDALSIIDVEQYTAESTYVTSSLQITDVTQTANKFSDRLMQSSFSAAYFPDVTVSLTPAGDTVERQFTVPASVAAIGAIANNDVVLGTFGAPMGVKRGFVRNAIDANVSLLSTDIDKIISSNFNPILKDTNAGGLITIASQKTTYGQKSLFDRVNMRRLAIDVRRRVRNIARRFLFENVTPGVINAFRLAVLSDLQRIQTAGGIQDFRIIIDNTGVLGSMNFNSYISGEKPMSVGADSENRTLRGKVIIVPVASNEMIELDFSEGPI